MLRNMFKVNRTKCNTWRKQENFIYWKGPWQEISINIIGPLPKSNDKDTIVDWFTKIIKLKATTTVVLLEEIAEIY